MNDLLTTNKVIDVVDLQTHLFTYRGVIRAVDGVTFEINQKETMGLVGESGCGKTMTGLSILKLLPKPAKIIGGKILFKGNNLLELEENDMKKIRGKDISMVFQDPQTYLNPLFRVGDQVVESIVLHQNVTKQEAEEKAIEFLDIMGIATPSKVADYYPHQLSGGMKQRILIAIALSSYPSFVIADEPTSALDVTVQAQILDLLKRLKEDLGLSMMMITHDMGVVAEICDRASIMYAGKIVENSDVDTLFEDPKHPYTSGLMKSVLNVHEVKERFSTIGGTVPDLSQVPSGCRFHPRCQYAKDICSKEEPPTIQIEQGHTVSCWLYS